MSIKQAIEALELAGGWVNAYGPDEARDKVRIALAALRSMPAEPEPFAWATFDGEGSYDLRLYQDNESYRDEYLKRNGPQFRSWVTPLFATPHTEAVRMSEAESHEAFETWARSFGKSGRDLEREDWDGKGEYKWITESHMFEAFKAGHARAVEQATAARLGVTLGDV